jgi:hypothetical protein
MRYNKKNMLLETLDVIFYTGAIFCYTEYILYYIGQTDDQEIHM